VVDIHPPHGSVHTAKDFLFHMLTVVLGILIALSLEGLIEWHHHQSLAAEARSNLTSEIRQNRDRLEKGLSLAPDAENRLKSTIERVEVYRKNHVAPSSGFDWSFGLFPLSDTAWKTASSTGAIAYMDYAEVPQYTRAYVLQEVFLAEQRGTVDKWLDLQKWAPRLDAKGGLSQLSAEDLAKIQEAASAALVHTQTEEGTAKTLIQEYPNILGDGSADHSR
jgi:hypothetical protein